MHVYACKAAKHTQRVNRLVYVRVIRTWTSLKQLSIHPGTIRRKNIKTDQISFTIPSILSLATKARDLQQYISKN